MRKRITEHRTATINATGIPEEDNEEKITGFIRIDAKAKRPGRTRTRTHVPGLLIPFEAVRGESITLETRPEALSFYGRISEGRRSGGIVYLGDLYYSGRLAEEIRRNIHAYRDRPRGITAMFKEIKGKATNQTIDKSIYEIPFTEMTERIAPSTRQLIEHVIRTVREKKETIIGRMEQQQAFMPDTDGTEKRRKRTSEMATFANRAEVMPKRLIEQAVKTGTYYTTTIRIENNKEIGTIKKEKPKIFYSPWIKSSEWEK